MARASDVEADGRRPKYAAVAVAVAGAECRSRMYYITYKHTLGGDSCCRTGTLAPARALLSMEMNVFHMAPQLATYATRCCGGTKRKLMKLTGQNTLP